MPPWLNAWTKRALSWWPTEPLAHWRWATNGLAAGPETRGTRIKAQAVHPRDQPLPPQPDASHSLSDRRHSVRSLLLQLVAARAVTGRPLALCPGREQWLWHGPWINSDRFADPSKTAHWSCKQSTARTA